jgi:PAS domain S-box-containing protein
VSELPEALDGLRILLIDDDEVDRMSIRRALRSGGVRAELIEASDATTALEQLCSQRFDCAFLDVNMPGRDGLWLVREARRRSIHAPLIVLTGQGDERIAVELMKAGASDYFAKASATPERLVGSLRQALRVAAAEDALRQSEERLRLAVEATELGTWDYQPSTGRLDWSERCKALFGLPPHAEVTYPAFLARLHPEDRARVDASIQRSLDSASGGVYDDEYRTVGLVDAVERWVRATGRTLFDDAGRPLRFVGTAQDIGQRKQLDAERIRLLDAERLARERAEAASRMREDLVAIVSHDLRNPLSSIAMSVSLLRSTLPAESLGRAGKQLEIIARSAERMKRLISDLLDVASIDAGHLSVSTEPQPIDALLRDAVEMLQPLAADKSIHISLGETPEWLVAVADKERIIQVLSNLIGNAIKFTREGGSIVVAAQSHEGMVRVTVSDTGQGLSEEQMPHLFDRYWQARKDGRLGIGLGLTIAKGIVEAHGGRIWAESVLGRGTTFSFTLASADVSASSLQVSSRCRQSAFCSRPGRTAGARARTECGCPELG